jgi:UDPglucose--hexose-1-phosphate uridylyltransferase
MGEFRRDRTNGLWAIIAPARGDRPRQPLHDETAAARPSKTGHLATCPFCPGNEHMLAPVIEETACDAPPGWHTRVVLNKFPILSGGPQVPPDPLQAGYGRHEVIIETPRHDADLPDLSPAELRALVATWFNRFAALQALAGIEDVILFRNHGKRAGASLGHAHSQIIALPVLTPQTASAREWAQCYREENGRCVTCDELKLESAAGERIVELTDEFAVLVPFAARRPFEQWIVPRRHDASFPEADERQRAALGPLLQRTLRRLKRVAGDAAYNLVVEPGSACLQDAPSSHWTIRIVPNMTTPGGFELQSGIIVNPQSPEHDAELLRA